MKDLPNQFRPLEEGEEVVVRTSKEDRWIPSMIIKAHKTSRFSIVDNSINHVRRNGVHIKPIDTSASNHRKPVFCGALWAC